MFLDDFRIVTAAAPTNLWGARLEDCEGCENRWPAATWNSGYFLVSFVVSCRLDRGPTRALGPGRQSHRFAAPRATNPRFPEGLPVFLRGNLCDGAGLGGDWRHGHREHLVKEALGSAAHRLAAIRRSGKQSALRVARRGAELVIMPASQCRGESPAQECLRPAAKHCNSACHYNIYMRSCTAPKTEPPRPSPLVLAVFSSRFRSLTMSADSQLQITRDDSVKRAPP